MRRATIALTVFAVLLAGCAGATHSTAITADTALVTVMGSESGKRSELIDASLREAARYTRRQGYRYFVVLDMADASVTERRIVPPANVYGEGVTGIPYLKAMQHPTANNPGMQTLVGESIPYIRPGLDLSIRMYHEGEVDPSKDGVWNSDAVLAGNGSSR